MDAETAVRNAHIWFETSSGWAPPDDDTLADWLADGISRSPDDCLVTPTGWCPHGLASWPLILTALAQEDAKRRTPRTTGSSSVADRDAETHWRNQPDGGLRSTASRSSRDSGEPQRQGDSEEAAG